MSCTFPEWATTPSIWELVLTIRFPLSFAALALSIGSASFLNGKLVMHTGIRWMASRAAVAVGGSPSSSASQLPFGQAFHPYGA